MKSLITCSIDYHSLDVLCFDPQKVLSKLRLAFPGTELDQTDLSAAEVNWVMEYTQGNLDMSDKSREIMRRQILGKQQRMWPAYRFRFSETVTGHVNRYSLVFKTEGEFNEIDKQNILDFLKSLRAGTIKTSVLS